MELSRGEFAKLTGITPQMVSKYKGQGKLNQLPTGKYDTEDRLNMFYVKERQEKIVAENLTSSAPPKTSDFLIPKNIQSSPSNIESMVSEKTHKAEKAKWDAVNAKLKAEKEMGITVEVDLVQQIFNKIGAIVNNDLLQRGQRDAGIICGTLGVSDSDKILEIKKMIELSDIRTIQSIKQECKNFTKELKKRVRKLRQEESPID